MGQTAVTRETATARLGKPEPSGKDQPSDAVATAPQGLDDLNKIRDILFGAQVAEQTQRATRLEETIARMGAELSREMDLRFQSLEASLTKHVADLTAKLSREEESRLGALAAARQEMTELGRSLSGATALLGEHTKQEQADVRRSLTEQHDALLKELHQRNDALTTKMEHALAELRSEKVTRATLAELFVKSAQSLAGTLDTAGTR